MPSEHDINDHMFVLSDGPLLLHTLRGGVILPHPREKARR